jgi:hypothetical protein
MVYYDLVKEKQVKHNDVFAEVVTSLPIPDLVLFNEKIEDRTERKRRDSKT